jgi:hypothetical protein
MSIGNFARGKFAQPLACAGILLLVGFAYGASLPPSRPPGGDGNASFPHVDDSWSPDARFVLKNVDTPDDPQSPHSIFMTDMKTGDRARLYTYAQRADVLWSPGSDALAINDWDSNDDSQCMVFPRLPNAARTDLREEFLKSRRPDREKKLAADHIDYDHNYAHVVRWLDAKTVLFVLQGHNSDNRRKFLLEYTYRIGDSFRLIRRVIQ